MEGKKYSVIDIETTGGQREGHKIIEIAIINLDGVEVVEKFSTLINPEKNIPWGITRLTGITNEMVVDAPKFYEVAKKIVELTENRIFIAHNVFFDYNFIKREFRELGYTFNREKICSVRMARKYLPGHDSYSLGKVCADLGIKIDGRHRAMGDALATVELLKIIWSKTNQEETHDFVKSTARKISLPTNLDYDLYENAPETYGVYYFYDDQKRLLYVGKSNNIKKRLASHFRAEIKRRKDAELRAKIADISYELMGNELASLLYECSEIKKNHTPFNRSLNRRRFPYCIKLIKNEEGYFEEKVCSASNLEGQELLFTSRKAAKKKVDSVYRALVGHETDSLHFNDAKEKLKKTLGQENYNVMFYRQLRNNIDYPPNFYVKLAGRKRGEDCIIKVKEFRPKTIEYVSKSGDIQKFKLYSDEDLKNLFFNYLNKYKIKYFID